MKPSILYRIAAILLLLFAIGHTAGFSQADPSWHVDGVLSSMQSVHFDVQGASRTYWDFFLAAGFTVGALYLFAAILAWQLGSLSPATLRSMRLSRWSFALCFAVITALSARYLFVIPIVLSGAATICLVAAALVANKETQPIGTS